jgi:hypothetical protein
MEVYFEGGACTLPHPLVSFMDSNINKGNAMKIRQVCESKPELDNFFKNLENTVPRREENRHAERQIKKEIYCLERYFRTPALCDRLGAFPIEITQQESPDFWLKSSTASIGVEVTEATNEDYQKFLSEDSKRVEADNILPSYNEDGYVGDSVESQAAEAVISCISKKSKKLVTYRSNNPDVTSYELLVYVNMDLEPDLEPLLQLIRCNLTRDHGFDCISIITGELCSMLLQNHQDRPYESATTQRFSHLCHSF